MWTRTILYSQSLRTLSSKAKKCTPHGTCPEPVVEGPEPEPKRGFFRWLFGKKKKRKVMKQKEIVCPPVRKRVEKECDCWKPRKEPPEPDLRLFGGQHHRTCGPGAYIIQKSLLPQQVYIQTQEDKHLKTMEIHPEAKKIVDPLPNFESVEKRLIDLSDHRLHPLYKIQRAIPKKKPIELTWGGMEYKTHSGPVCPHDIPVQLKFNKELLDQKNLNADVKRVEPPLKLIGRIVEMNLNRRKTLEPKKEKKDDDDETKNK